MARELIDVIDAMLGEIPAGGDALANALRHHRTAVIYTAPEAMLPRWHETAAILIRHMPVLQADWEKRVAAIFNGTAS